MKNNNINLLDEIIQVINNHLEYNVSDISMSCNENKNGSFSYKIDFSIENSSLNEEPIQTLEMPVPSTVDSSLEISCENKEPLIYEEKTNKELKKMCKTCAFFFEIDGKSTCEADTKNKRIYAEKTIGISNCWTAKD